MAHFVFYDTPAPPLPMEKLLKIRSELTYLQLELACTRLELLLRKANFNPNQPRVPAGSPDGGRWIDSGSAGGSARPGSIVPRVPKPRIEVRPRGIGDNGGPPLEEPPHVPKEPPPSTKLRNAVIKRTAKWLLKAAARHAIPEVGLYLDIIDAATWIHDSYPYIQAYLDEPKSLYDLQQAVSPKTSAPGYEDHHIVEQAAAEDDGFPRSLIEGRDNVVRIPVLKHWEITGWYMTRNDAFGGLSPREYIRGKDWSERVRVGQEALRKFGVLKP